MVGINSSWTFRRSKVPITKVKALFKTASFSLFNCLVDTGDDDIGNIQLVGPPGEKATPPIGTFFIYFCNSCLIYILNN